MELSVSKQRDLSKPIFKHQSADFSLRPFQIVVDCVEVDILIQFLNL